MNDKLPFETNEEITISRYAPSGTALVHIDPVVDAKVRALGQEVIAIVKEAEARVVLSDADVHGATESIALIAGLRKAFEEKRREYTVPLNGYLKDINSAFKGYTDPLEEAENRLKGKVIAYDAEIRAINRAREEANRLKKEAAEREMRLTGELSESVGLLEVAPEPPSHYHSVAGDLGKAKVWEFEVENFALLPDEYKLPDAVKIRRVVVAGASIPGVRAWQKETLRASAPK